MTASPRLGLRCGDAIYCAAGANLTARQTPIFGLISRIVTDAQHILAQAETALAEKRIEDAETLASAVEKREGRSSALLDLRARIAILRDDLASAVGLYTEALAVEPANPGLLHALARLYAARKEWKPAAAAAMSARKNGVAF